jgi:hypothetical protein
MQLTRLIAPAALYLMTLTVPGNAAPQRQEFRGLNTFVDTFFSDACTSTGMFLFATEATIRNTSTGTIEVSTVVVTASVFNFCTGTGTYMALEGEAVITGGIENRVRVISNVTGSQVDQTTFVSSPVSGVVDVTLTTTEQPVQTRSVNMFVGPFSFQRFRSLGKSAEATVSGKIVLGGIDYLAAAVGSGHDVRGRVNWSNTGSMEKSR